MHQGWELYGSDRSFLTNLELLKELYPTHKLVTIIPRSGPIQTELVKIVDSLEIGEIGKIERWYAKKYPIRSLIKIFRAAPVCRKKMRSADLVYINTIVPFGFLLASWLFSKPVIVHVREIPPRSFSSILKLWFSICKINVIFNSRATAESFNMLNYKRGVIIENAVDKVEVDENSVVENNKINLLLIGRISGWKGQDFFVKSFSQNADTFSNMYYVRIVGNAPDGQEYYEDRLKELIDSNNLNKSISLFPFIQDPTEHFKWADVVVVPSIKPEPFGRVSIEAFSCKTPVIAANHGGLSQIVTNGMNGWLFDPANSDDLCKVLLSINKDELEIMGANAFRTYEERYTLEKYKLKFQEYIIKIKPSSDVEESS